MKIDFESLYEFFKFETFDHTVEDCFIDYEYGSDCGSWGVTGITDVEARTPEFELRLSYVEEMSPDGKIRLEVPREDDGMHYQVLCTVQVDELKEFADHVYLKGSYDVQAV